MTFKLPQYQESLIGGRMVADELNALNGKAPIPQFTPDKVTCVRCPLNAQCQWAFDLYNTDGDCLALK